MNERNLDWLFHQPRPGVVEQWVSRHSSELQTYPVIDESVCLAEKWQDVGPDNFGYRPDQITLSKDGTDVPFLGSELWVEVEKYTADQLERMLRPSNDRPIDTNGPKLHLSKFTAWLSHRNYIHFQMSQYDWWRVRVLNMGLREGRINPEYREEILPVLEGDSFHFRSKHPNWAIVHGVVITADNHLILTRRARGSDFHSEAVSVSMEEQMNGEEDNSPFDTFKSAVDINPKMEMKTRGGAELRLRIQPKSLGLASMILEPDVNGSGFIILGRCEESSEDIDAKILGRDRAEFDPTRPIWTLPLGSPDLAIKQLLDPPFRWHGSSRLRLLTALYALHGFDEVNDRLTFAHQELTN